MHDCERPIVHLTLYEFHERKASFVQRRLSFDPLNQLCWGVTCGQLLDRKVALVRTFRRHRNNGRRLAERSSAGTNEPCSMD